MRIIINYLRLLPLNCPRVTVMKTVDLIKTLYITLGQSLIMIFDSVSAVEIFSIILIKLGIFLVVLFELCQT